MANTLPHLVIFTAEDEPTSDSERSDSEDDTDMGSPKKQKQQRLDRPSQSLIPKLPPRTFAVHLLTEPDDVLSLLVTIVPSMLIIEHEGGDDETREVVKEVLKRMRNGGASSGKRTFIVLWSLRAVKDARERSYWSSKGVNMVTDSIGSIIKVLSIIQHHYTPSTSFFHNAGSSQQLTAQHYACPFCGINLPLQSLAVHVPLFHTQEPGGAVCTVCKENVAFLPKHLREAHLSPMTPEGSLNSSQRGSKSSLGIYLSDEGSPRPPKRVRQPVFALVIVRRLSDGKFLMVDEVARQGWWLPGGGVDMGEDLVKAAERETFEEAGVKITVKGVLRLEYTPSQHGFRMRVIFYAEPIDENQRPKTIPDVESAGACWVGLDQLGDHIQLRGKEPAIWFPYVANGGAIWPLPVLSREKDDVSFIPSPFRQQIEEDPATEEAQNKSSFPNLTS
ncbi:hypothetical protein HDU97_000685 [Phlyctochytrium planicorne]|nr:hypothetical protein HDU97_000685 [Phlyctochytrium planicorne]